MSTLVEDLDRCQQGNSLRSTSGRVGPGNCCFVELPKAENARQMGFRVDQFRLFNTIKSCKTIRPQQMENSNFPLPLMQQMKQFGLWEKLPRKKPNFTSSWIF
ncbi:hypothetical protein T02_6215 [Trichinella nativa]|uniref:Uncharacterized protein n=1 Tax=Trichinella nativa TaxID=6335 RepID=A0A0V1L2A1_9BILA|nr:hypothetical protein T06_5489 [Trichinella sp. T6]KRZ53397.1 hypothetical protein T02_6215 [Trichinella nativa]